MSYYTKITKAGLAAITAAMNNNTKVPITYMAFGDGNGYIPEPDEDASSLVNEVYRVGLNKVEVHSKNPNWLVCEAIIPSAVGGFNIREVALYDSTGNTMLAIASYPPTYKPTVEEGAAKIQTIRIVIQVDNSGNFELIIDPDVVLATNQMLIEQTDLDKKKLNGYDYSVLSKLKETVSCEEFGAIGDGTLHTLQEWIDSGKFSNLISIQFVYPNASSLNDSIDSVTIQSALNYCYQNNKKLLAVSGKEYVHNQSILISCDCDFTNTKFLLDRFNGNAVVISSENVDIGILTNLEITLPSLNNNKGASTPPDNSVGVLISNGVRNCKITFNDIRGFNDNLKLYSDKSAKFIAYNNFIFNGLFIESKNNIHLHIHEDGWVNQCTWIGGQFAQFSNDRNLYPAVNLKITKTNPEQNISGNNPPNGHTFFGCSMEGNFSNTIEYNLPLETKTTYYSNNTFINCRFESATSMKFSVYALYDLFIGCYGLYEVNYVNNVIPNIVGSSRISNHYIDVAAILGSVNSRSAKNTHSFGVGNTASAIAIAAKFDKTINGGLLGSGSYVLFKINDPSRLYPILSLQQHGGLPSLLMGSGDEAPTEKLYRYAPKDWRMNFNLRADESGIYSLGSPNSHFLATYTNKIMYTATVGDFLGTGSPEGFVSAGIGSTYRRADGAAGTTFYVKETGTGNTGWIAK